MLRHRCPAAAPPRRCAAATNYDPYPVNSSSASHSHFQHMTTTGSHPREDTTALLQQTTVALSQIQHLLRQATNIMADLHTRFLHHIGQADPTFHRTLPPPPTRSINHPLPPATHHHLFHEFATHLRHQLTPTHLLPLLHPSTHLPASANSHHHLHSIHMQTGMLGTVTPSAAS